MALLAIGLPAFGLLTADAEHPVGHLGVPLQVGVQGRRVVQIRALFLISLNAGFFAIIRIAITLNRHVNGRLPKV
jgi:hypothetical protein